MINCPTSLNKKKKLKKKNNLIKSKFLVLNIKKINFYTKKSINNKKNQQKNDKEIL